MTISLCIAAAAARNERGREGCEKLFSGVWVHKHVGHQRTRAWGADDGHDCHLMARNQKTESRERWHGCNAGMREGEEAHFKEYRLGAEPYRLLLFLTGSLVCHIGIRKWQRAFGFYVVLSTERENCMSRQPAFIVQIHMPCCSICYRISVYFRVFFRK